MTRTFQLRFATNNAHKIAEATEILGSCGVEVIPVRLKIEELQTTDTKRLIHDKLLKAFSQVGRPLFVEHTGLYVEAVGGLPGGLTQIFWDTLQAEAFAKLFGNAAEPSNVVARTSIAYCDGKSIHDFDGEISGQLVQSPRGSRDFQWDCVFQPWGYEQTFAEMGENKNKISMRRAALDRLAIHFAVKSPGD